ncbi:DNA repair protein RecO [Candidatus Saccharibacteria bacterium]|nr:DNA repair protein RecO [Candidatus Saccharibacteria bacterium]
MPKDLRDKAIVLRRTKYGEADRILSLLIPNGKIDVIAKGVRKEKSKLAGGIELFSVSEITVHQDKADRLGILTSSKMLKFYNNILADLNKLELASNALRQVARLSDDVDEPELFSVLDQTLAGLHNDININLVEAWLLFNLASLSGEPVNLFRDNTGLKLQPEQAYYWDSLENALHAQPDGPITANHIKLMRLMTVSPLVAVAKVKSANELLPDILPIARSVV